MMLSEGAIKRFASGLRGGVIRKGDPLYEEARKVWNAMIDRKPQLIVRCQGTVDVVHAVNFARDHGLPLSVRGGGHNIAGNAICDDGLVVDLSPMKEIRVDAQRRVATAQPGVTWKELDEKTQAFGLATPGGFISSTGIAGLTLGGGIAWLMRKHGLACDNLLGVEIVAADGRVLRASADENPDLFWAVRGGGGNFGVVTSFEYRLHPLPGPFLGGAVIHPLERGHEVFRFFRKVMEGAPDDLMALPALLPSPQGVPVSGIVAAYFGSIKDGERALRPLREFGPPLADQIQPITYTTLQTIFDPFYQSGFRNYWKSSFLSDLTDEAIDTIVRYYRMVPSPRTIVYLEAFGGAVARVGRDETAFDHRDVAFNLNITSAWSDPAEDEANIAWTRALWKSLQPFFSRRVYVNYLGEEKDEGPDRIIDAYGKAKYGRLAVLKKKYDPGNLFHFNQNINPAA